MKMVEGRGIAKNCILFPEFIERRAELRANAQSSFIWMPCALLVRLLPEGWTGDETLGQSLPPSFNPPVYSQASLPMIHRIALRATLDFGKGP
jgi:hypothetical protein